MTQQHAALPAKMSQTSHTLTRMLARDLAPDGALTALLQQSLGELADPRAFLARYRTVVDEDRALQNVHPAEHVRAIQTLAAMGAMPCVRTTPQNLRECALIVRGQQLTVMPEWRLLKRRIERHSSVSRAQAVFVFVGDRLALDLDRNVAEHIPADPFAEVEPDFGNIKGGYVEVTLRDGTRRTHYVSRAHIEKAKSAAQTDKVWKAWPTQMARKTLWRAAAAADIVPLGNDDAMAAALRADDDAMGYTVTDHGPTRTIGQSTRTADVYDAIPAEAAAAVGADPHATQRPAPESLSGDALRSAVLEAAGGDLDAIDRVLEGQPLGEADDDALTYALGQFDSLRG